jgi:hypothetical protein
MYVVCQNKAMHRGMSVKASVQSNALITCSMNTHKWHIYNEKLITYFLCMTLEMALSYDWVNTISTQYSTASVATTSIVNPSIDLFVYTVGIDGYCEVANARVLTEA